MKVIAVISFLTSPNLIFIPSSGIGDLVVAKNFLHSEGKTMALVNPQSQVQTALELMKIPDIIPTFLTLLDAIKKTSKVKEQEFSCEK